ncbi:hypothetical protein K1T71_011544 [Dendrolimus kikuchii]|uniref:Uncharacterized protein n=1 Tax=Dendrolimus kikuchii TaxID=765133 RepID=A0ACC1CPE0_9NEOP|nr:hypothetical protein K1T71_011544 [Dendrolimus kikuchii]
MTEKPIDFEKPIKENGKESLLRSLLRNVNEPKQTVSLDNPVYTVINVNGQPKLVKQSDLLRGNNNEQLVRTETISKSIKPDPTIQDDDNPANQSQKLALLGLYVKQGFSVPRLGNGKIDWATIVKELKENSNTEENSSESVEEEDTPGTSLNEKLLKVIQKVKDSVLQLPTIDIGNIDLRHLIKKESSKENKEDENYSNSSNQLEVLKKYLKSGGSIPFVAPSKTIWDEFLNNIQKKEHMTSTENTFIKPSNNYGVKDPKELVHILYQTLNKPVRRLQNSNINWTATANALENKNKNLKAGNIKTDKPVTNTDDVEINYETLDLKDLLEMIKDLRQPGMTKDKVMHYLREKQKEIERKTEKPVQMKYITNDDEYPDWDFSEKYLSGLNKEVGIKSAHLPTRLSYNPAKYNY